MSTTALSGATSPKMNDFLGVGGTDNSQLEEFLECLIEELKQLLSQLNFGSDDDGSSPNAGGVTPGASATPLAWTPLMRDAPGTGTTSPPAPGDSTTPPAAPAPSPTSNPAPQASPPVSNDGSVNTDGHDAIVQGLQQYGLNDNAIKAVLGNADEESGDKSNAIEGGGFGAPTSDVAEDNSDGYGLFQMSGAQKAAFLNWAQQNNRYVEDPKAQMDFLMQDPQFTGALDALKAQQNTGSVADLTTTFEQQYEKAVFPNLDVRISDAESSTV